MIKVTESSYNFDRPISCIVPVGSKGIDTGWTVKTASLLSKELSEITSEPGTTVIHTLALGSTERYGPNRNADGFSRDHCKKTHGSFVKSGRFHRNHDNKDPSKAIGKIVCSAYNDEMDRVELVVRLDNNKADEEVQKLSSGEDLPVSMGCRVAYDVCSICGHKAPSPKHYCEHTKTAMGKILHDGRQVYVDNPNPDFFELSSVHRPADRIGFTFRKVASAEVISSVKVAEALDLWLPAHVYAAESGQRALNKLAALERLASMEKHIECDLSPMDKIIGASTGSGSFIDSSGIGRLVDNPEKGFGQLHANKVMLSLKDFIKLLEKAGLKGGTEAIEDIQDSLPGIFGRLLSSPHEALASSYFDGDDGESCCLSSTNMMPLLSGCSLHAEPMQKRITITILRGSKLASAARVYKKSTPFVNAIADLYASYKLAFLTHPKNLTDSLLTKSAILQHYHH